MRTMKINHFFFLKKRLIYFREHERVRAGAAAGGMGENLKQRPHWAQSLMWGSISWPWDHNLSQNQLNQLSHAGALQVFWLKVKNWNSLGPEINPNEPQNGIWTWKTSGNWQLRHVYAWKDNEMAHAAMRWKNNGKRERKRKKGKMAAQTILMRGPW